MKTLKFTVPTLIVAISLLISSRGVTGGALATNSNMVNHTPVAQAKIPISSSTDVDRQWVENDSVVGSNPTNAALATQSEVITLNDQYLDEQWALSHIQILKLWQITTGNRETLVAVLDTGIDQNHEDLSGKVVVEVNFTDSLTSSDVHGHGTHIAGIIAADSNNGIGIAGIAPESQLMNVKVADDKGRCQALTVAKGIIWAVNNGASVINISIELEQPSPELEDAINYAWSQGTVIVAAAGNEGSQSPVYPAFYENCIAVTAIKQDDNLAPLSNYGDWVDIAAPGFNIYSTLPDNSYGYKSGTSFATAYVSGIAALLFDVVIDTSGDGRLNDEVRAAIEAGCQEIGVGGVGGGKIDAAEILAFVLHCE
jgi:thermitase